MKKLLFILIVCFTYSCGNTIEEDNLEVTSSISPNPTFERLDTSMFTYMIRLPLNKKWECIDTLENEIIYKTCCKGTDESICHLYENFHVDLNGMVIKVRGEYSGTSTDLMFDYNNKGELISVIDSYQNKTYTN